MLVIKEIPYCAELGKAAGLRCALFLAHNCVQRSL